MKTLCIERFEAFDIADNACKIKVISLFEMAKHRSLGRTEIYPAVSNMKEQRTRSREIVL